MLLKIVKQICNKPQILIPLQVENREHFIYRLIMKILINLIFVFSVILIGSCTTDLPWNDFQPNGGFGPGGGMPGGQGGSMSGALIDLDGLNSFTIDFDHTPLSEKEELPADISDPYFNEYVENNFSAKETTSIRFTDNGAVIEGLVTGDTITTEGDHILVKAHNEGFVLKVSGKTENGSLCIYSDKKFELILSDTQICNPEGAAINIQKGNCFVVLDGENSLSDGSAAQYAKTNDEDEKAVFFSEDDLRFSGKGSLNITAVNSIGKSCLASDDAMFFRPRIELQLKAGASAGHGIKANDAIVVKGGVFNIQTEANGKKAITCDGLGHFAGGRITAITTGGVDNTVATDLSGSACFKIDSTLLITGGELRLKSTGQGGKGISCDQNIQIEGGDLYIITTGAMYGTSNDNRPGWGGNNSSSDNSVSPKGIKGDQNVTISGGNIFIRTSGTNAEGIESKTTLSFTGGNTAVSAYDDGLNASKAINVSGGRVFSASNGAGDGIDSNGSISATGGVMIGIASTMSSEEGIDLENSTFTISNATVISLGGGMRGGMGSRYNGHYVSTSVSGEAGSCIALANGTTPLLVFRLPRICNGANLLMSSPSLSTGSYQLINNATAQGGTYWMNLLEGATSVSEGSAVTVQAS